jgi:hypothetical protein
MTVSMIVVLILITVVLIWLILPARAAPRDPKEIERTHMIVILTGDHGR